jgi:Flp pilus assembly protein TadD
MIDLRREVLMTTRLFTAHWAIYRRCLLMSIILPALLCSCASSVVTRSTFENVDREGLPSHSDNPDAEDKMQNLSAQELVDNGRIHLSQGNLSLAKIHFLLSVKKAPEELPAYIELARTLEQEQDYEKAENVYGGVLNKKPDYLPAMIGQGRLMRQQGQAEKALTLLMQVNSIAPTNAAGLNELAITLDTLGKEIFAEKYYLAIVELRPELAAAYNNLGFNYLLQKKYPAALSAFQKAYFRDPQNIKILNNLATTHALAGNEGKALEIFERALDKPAAYNNLGYLYLVQGKTREAKDALTHAMEINPIYYARARENLETIERFEPGRSN